MTELEEGVEIAAALCRRFEGLRLRPYLCPAGVPTIGYGSTRHLTGVHVTLQDAPVTAEIAERMLLLTIRCTYAPAVVRLCPGVTDPDRLGALIDFAYNLGTGALQASTLRRRVNAGNWAAVPSELRKWVYARGKKLRGLELRREAEVALILNRASK